jgi:hypothetical protein
LRAARKLRAVRKRHLNQQKESMQITELHSPQKFLQKEVGHTESSKTVQRPTRELCNTRQVKKGIRSPKKNVTHLENSRKQDVGLLQTPVRKDRRELSSARQENKTIRYPQINLIDLKDSGKQDTELQ